MVSAGLSRNTELNSITEARAACSARAVVCGSPSCTRRESIERDNKHYVFILRHWHVVQKVELEIKCFLQYYFRIKSSAVFSYCYK